MWVASPPPTGATQDTSLFVHVGPGIPPLPPLSQLPMTDRIARERIDRLDDLASDAIADGEPELAKTYVRLARRIAERNRVDLPVQFKRFTCKRCDAYLRPGINARVRLQDGHVVITCDCGEQTRHPYE